MEHDASEASSIIAFFSFFLNQAIAPYIPTSTVKLSSAIYEMVLYDFLKKDYKVIIPDIHVPSSLVPRM